MAAPAHDPARNSDWAIRLTPRIVVDPNYSVQPNVTPNAPAPEATSFEGAQQRAFDQGRQFERNGGRSMADAKKDDHGHGHGIPSWLQNTGIAVILFILFAVTLLWLVNGVNRVVDPTGAAIADLRNENADLRSALTQRGYDRGGGGTRTATGGASRPAAVARLPSPQELWDRADHKRGYTCAPCDQSRGFSYVQDPVTCQCDGVRWRPGPPPQ